MASPQDNYLRFPPYLDLMTGIRTALKINEGIIKVVAAEGCGKTTFCRELVHDLEAEGQDVIFFDTPPESVDYLHQHIQSELGLPREKNFTRSLTHYLLAKKPPNNKLILIYDDAEKINKEIFILIRLLNNIHNDSETLVSQVICGTSKLDKVFDDPDLRSLTQYLNQSFTLKPMTREEIADFCLGYRQQTGRIGRDLTSRELTDIFMVGKGKPGKTLELLEQLAEKTASAANAATAVQESDAPGTESSAEKSAAVKRRKKSSKKGSKKTGKKSSKKSTRQSSKKSIMDKAEQSDMLTPEPETPVPAPARDSAIANYARELDEILDEDDSTLPSVPMSFKVILSVIVIVTTVVLTVVLSGESEVVNNRIAKILADDSPLYLDQARPASTAPNTRSVQQPVSPPQTTPVPVINAPAEQADTGNAAVAANENRTTTAPALSEPTVLPTEQERTVTAPTAMPQDERANTAEPEESDVDALLADAEPDANEEELVLAEAEPMPAATVAALTGILRTWSLAWQAGDYNGYIAAYHEDFSSPDYGSLAAWAAYRRPKVAGIPGMTISVDRFEITEADDEEVTAQFWLSYSRGFYEDETLKEVVFQWQNGNWLIRSERNLEVIVK